MVEVGPGVVVTAEEASFIFERLHWSKEGELESFKMRAPSTMKFDDICTLSRLLLDEDFEEARELVKLKSFCKNNSRTLGNGATPSIAGSSLPESPMEHLKKNAGEGWKKERDNIRSALKDTKTYIHAPLMMKKVTKAGKEKISRRKNADRRDIDPQSTPIKIIEAAKKCQARTALMPAKVNRLKMSVMIDPIKLFPMFIFSYFLIFRVQPLIAGSCHRREEKLWLGKNWHVDGRNR